MRHSDDRNVKEKREEKRHQTVREAKKHASGRSKNTKKNRQDLGMS